jgi:hypothetical protein
VTTTKNIAAPTVSINNDNGLALNCSVINTNLTASGGGNYLWSNAATTPTINVTTAGSFTVTVTSPNGCTASSSVTTTLNNTPPTVSINNDNGLALNCSVTNTNLTASGGGNYLWSNAATTPSINVTTAGTFTVTVTSPNGCTATSSVTITVITTIPTIIAGTMLPFALAKAPL